MNFKESAMPRWRPPMPVADWPPTGIAILGLGEVGSALARALRPIIGGAEIWGYDAETSRAIAAQRAGEIDQWAPDPASAVRAAGLVFLTERSSQLSATLAAVAGKLRPGTILSDTARLKVPVLAAAAQYLPASVSFVGGHPILREPRADAGALEGAVYCLVPAPTASEDALRRLSDLVTAVGARPFYVDAAEHDALVAMLEVIPSLLDAVRLALVAKSPAARDLWQLTNVEEQASVARLADWWEQAAEDLEATRQATAMWLDRLLVELAGWRAALAEEGSAALVQQLTAYRKLIAALPPPELDADAWAANGEAPSLLRQMMFGRLLGPRSEERGR